MGEPSSSQGVSFTRPVRCESDDWRCLLPGDYALQYRIKQSGPTCSLYTILMTMFTCPALLRKLEIALRQVKAAREGEVSSYAIPELEINETFITNFLKMPFTGKEEETVFDDGFYYISPEKLSDCFSDLGFILNVHSQNFMSWWRTEYRRNEFQRNEFDIFRMGYYIGDDGRPKTFKVDMMDNFRAVDPTIFVRLVLAKAGVRPVREGFEYHDCIKIFIDFDKFFENCLDGSNQHMIKKSRGTASGYYSPWADNIEELAARAIQPFMQGADWRLRNEDVNVTVQFVHGVARPVNRFCTNLSKFEENIKKIFREANEFAGEFERLLNSRQADPVAIQRSNFMVTLQMRGLETYHSVMFNVNQHGYIEVLDGNYGVVFNFEEWWFKWYRFPFAIISVAFILVPSVVAPR